MLTRKDVERFLALFIAVSFALPPPALALRPLQPAANAGLEDEISQRLGRPAAGLEGVVTIPEEQQAVDHIKALYEKLSEKIRYAELPELNKDHPHDLLLTRFSARDERVFVWRSGPLSVYRSTPSKKIDENDAQLIFILDMDELDPQEVRRLFPTLEKLGLDYDISVKGLNRFYDDIGSEGQLRVHSFWKPMPIVWGDLGYLSFMLDWLGVHRLTQKKMPLLFFMQLKSADLQGMSSVQARLLLGLSVVSALLKEPFALDSGPADAGMEQGLDELLEQTAASEFGTDGEVQSYLQAVREILRSLRPKERRFVEYWPKVDQSIRNLRRNIDVSSPSPLVILRNQVRLLERNLKSIRALSRQEPYVPGTEIPVVGVGPVEKEDLEFLGEAVDQIRQVEADRLFKESTLIISLGTALEGARGSIELDVPGKTDLEKPYALDETDPVARRDRLMGTLTQEARHSWFAITHPLEAVIAEGSRDFEFREDQKSAFTPSRSPYIYLLEIDGNLFQVKAWVEFANQLDSQPARQARIRQWSKESLGRVAGTLSILRKAISEKRFMFSNEGRLLFVGMTKRLLDALESVDPPSTPPQTAGMEELEVQTGAANHIGDRSQQQDYHSEELVLKDASGAPLAVARMVADGIASHVAGDVASREAVARMTAYLQTEEIRKALVAFRDSTNRELLQYALSHIIEGFYQAHRRLQDMQRADLLRYGDMGTTLSLGLILESVVYGGTVGMVFWMGDSPIYRWNSQDQTLERLNYDDSIEAEAQIKGTYTEKDLHDPANLRELAEAIEQRPQFAAAIGKAITQSVGRNVREAHFNWTPLRAGNSLLLFSDGVTRKSDHQKLESIVSGTHRSGLTSDQMAKQIVERSVPDPKKGDNRTAAVMRVRESRETELPRNSTWAEVAAHLFEAQGLQVEVVDSPGLGQIFGWGTHEAAVDLLYGMVQAVAAMPQVKKRPPQSPPLALSITPETVEATMKDPNLTLKLDLPTVAGWGLSARRLARVLRQAGQWSERDQFQTRSWEKLTRLHSSDPALAVFGPEGTQQLDALSRKAREMGGSLKLEFQPRKPIALTVAVNRHQALVHHRDVDADPGFPLSEEISLYTPEEITSDWLQYAGGHSALYEVVRVSLLNYGLVFPGGDRFVQAYIQSLLSREGGDKVLLAAQRMLHRYAQGMPTRYPIPYAAWKALHVIPEGIYRHPNINSGASYVKAVTQLHEKAESGQGMALAKGYRSGDLKLKPGRGVELQVEVSQAGHNFFLNPDRIQIRRGEGEAQDEYSYDTFHSSRERARSEREFPKFEEGVEHAVVVFSLDDNPPGGMVTAPVAVVIVEKIGERIVVWRLNDPLLDIKVKFRSLSQAGMEEGKAYLLFDRPLFDSADGVNRYTLPVKRGNVLMLVVIDQSSAEEQKTNYLFRMEGSTPMVLGKEQFQFSTEMPLRDPMQQQEYADLPNQVQINPRASGFPLEQGEELPILGAAEVTFADQKLTLDLSRADTQGFRFMLFFTRPVVRRIGEFLTTLEPHRFGNIHKLEVGPDGTIFTGADDGTIGVWRPQSVAPTYLKGHQSPVTSVAVSPDGNTLISTAAAGTGENDEILVWDIESGKEPTQISLSKGISALVFSPNDNRLFASADQEHGIVIWERDKLSRQVIGREPRWTPSFDIGGRTLLIEDLAFSPDGQFLVSSNRFESAKVRVWSVGRGRKDRLQSLQKLKAYDGGVKAVAFSPDGRWIASGGKDDTVRIWDVETGKEVHVLEHGFNVTDVAFHPEEEKLASIDVHRKLWLWDLNTGNPLRIFRLPPSESAIPLSNVAFGRGGELITAKGNLIEVRDLNHLPSHLEPLDSVLPYGEGTRYRYGGIQWNEGKKQLLSKAHPNGRFQDQYDDVNSLKEALVKVAELSYRGRRAKRLGLVLGNSRSEWLTNMRLWDAEDFGGDMSDAFDQLFLALHQMDPGGVVVAYRPWWVESERMVGSGPEGTVLIQPIVDQAGMEQGIGGSLVADGISSVRQSFKPAESPARPVPKRYVGQFLEGRPDRMARLEDVLHLGIGDEEVWKVRVDPAAIQRRGTIFLQDGAQIPPQWRGLLKDGSLPLSNNYDEAAQTLQPEIIDKENDLVLVSPRAFQSASEVEWNRLFRSRGLPGIQFTPDSILDIQNYNEAELAAFVASIRAVLREKEQGFFLVLGVEIRKGADEELYIYLHV